MEKTKLYNYMFKSLQKDIEFFAWKTLSPK